MFNINKISCDRNSGMHICICPCNSQRDAEYLVAKYIGISRMLSPSGNMYHRGTDAYIEAYLYDDVAKIAKYINANYFTPPLNISVFWGIHKDGLQSQWCIGFNFPPQQTQKLIEILNTQGPLIIANNNPQNWQDTNGNSYSIVMLTGITEHELSEKLQEGAKLCLNTIENVTARKLTIHTIH